MERHRHNGQDDASHGRPSVSTLTTGITGQPWGDQSSLYEYKSIKRASKSKGLLPEWLGVVQKTGQTVWNYFGRLFTVPLQHDPIYFHRAENDIQGRGSDGGGSGTAKCDYEDATRTLFERVFETKNKDTMKGRDAQDTAFTINLKNFPGWDDTVVDQLRNEFEACEHVKPGFVDFEQVNRALDNFGETSSRSDRRIHFDIIDQDRSGVLDFEEFCTIAYNLGKHPDHLPDTLQELYKNVDRDLSSIRRLSIVDQIQAGLF